MQDGAPTPTDDRTGGFDRAQIRVLVALTLAAVALRLYGISEWALWVDEAHSFRDATCDREVFWSSHVSRYPLSYLLLRGFLEVFPASSEGWLRLPFAFFGILSVPLLAILGRPLVGARAALWGALFLCVCPWHLYWSQNVRSYSIVMFFAMLMAFACHRAVVERSLRQALLFVLASVIAGFSHPSGFLLFALLLVYAGGVQFRQGLRPPRWLVLSVVVLIAVLGAILWANIDYFRRAKPGTSLLHLPQTAVYFLRVPVLVAAAGGFLASWSRDRRAAGFLASWALLPMATLAVVGAVVFQTTAQYAFTALPAYCLLAGVLAVRVGDAIAEAGWRRPLLQGCAGALIALEMLGYDALYFTSQYGDRPRWREAADFVAHRNDDPKLILTTNQPGMDYYLRRSRYWGGGDPDFVVVSIERGDVESAAGGGAGYLRKARQRAAAQGAELWVVLTTPEFEQKDPYGELGRAIGADGRLLQRLPAWTGPKDMTVLVYRVDPPPPSDPPPAPLPLRDR